MSNDNVGKRNKPKKISAPINFLNSWPESIKNEVLKHEIERKIT